jgi:hypothetical protein
MTILLRVCSDVLGGCGFPEKQRHGIEENSVDDKHINVRPRANGSGVPLVERQLLSQTQRRQYTINRSR